MPTDLEVFLADWKAKTDAATEGPWEAECFDDEGEVQVNAGTALTTWNEAGTVGTPASSWRETDRILDRDDLYDGDFDQVSDDAEFIAVSRTAMPKLLSAIENVLALCESPYEVPFEDSPPEGGVLVSDIRKAITDALNEGNEQ